MSLLDWIVKAAQLQTQRSRILNDPYYRLRSLTELQLAASLGIHIDVNQASVDDWLRLPGLSIHQARILSELTRSGVQLHSIEDIAAVLNLPLQRLKPLEPILQFCYYDPESWHLTQAIDANTATIEQLARLPGVDLHLARLIIDYRPYRNLSHLQQRLSLSSQLTSELLHYLRF